MKHAARLAAFALLPILTACHSPDDGHASSAMALKMYEVPPAQTSDLASALGRALGKDVNVSRAAPGKLLVYAPADAQSSIESAIASLRDAAPAKTVPTQVELHLWIINAEAGDAPDDPALRELAPSLASLRQTMGPASFHLEQTISAASATSRQGMLTLEDHGATQTFGFTFGPVHDDNTLSMEMDYHDHDNAANAGPKLTQLNAELNTRLGQYTVLAKAPGSCPASSATGAPPCEKSWRLLVVRVDSADSSH
jgi:hypothetical protein